jgi:hypothetical protein
MRTLPARAGWPREELPPGEAPAGSISARAGAPPGEPGAGLFGRRWRYLGALAGSVALLVLVTGGARHRFEPERYPFWQDWRGLPVPALRTFNPTLGALTAWVAWRAVDTGDFAPIYRAAQLRHRDARARLYEPEGLKAHRASFVYTPFAALLLSPLAALELSPTRAADVVGVLNHLLALAGLGLLLVVASAGRPLAPGDVALALLHALAFYPLARALHLTQATVWIFFCLALSAFLLQRGWPIAVGLALAVGVSIKPHLAVAVPLLWLVPRFPRRVLVACIAGVGATTAASLVYAGIENARDYVSWVLPTLSAGYAYFRDQSIGGILRRLAGAEDPAVFNLAQPVAWIRGVSALAGVGILGLTLLACRRSGAAGRGGRDLLCYAMVLTAAVLVSPVLWEHHFTVLLVGFAVAAGWLGRPDAGAPPWARPALLASFVLVAVYVETRYFRGFPLALLSGLQLYGGLLLLATLGAFLCPAGPRARAAAAPR